MFRLAFVFVSLLLSSWVCWSRVTQDKSTSLLHAPEILVLHVKRFRRGYLWSHKVHNRYGQGQGFTWTATCLPMFRHPCWEIIIFRGSLLLRTRGVTKQLEH